MSSRQSQTTGSVRLKRLIRNQPRRLTGTPNHQCPQACRRAADPSTLQAGMAARYTCVRLRLTMHCHSFVRVGCLQRHRLPLIDQSGYLQCGALLA